MSANEPVNNREQVNQSLEESQNQETVTQLNDSQQEHQAEAAPESPTGMDDLNRTAMEVSRTEGWNAAITHMFTDQASGRTLSYAEMRMRYG